MYDLLVKKWKDCYRGDSGRGEHRHQDGRIAAC